MHQHVDPALDQAIAACWGCRDILRRAKADHGILRYQPICPACRMVFLSIRDMAPDTLQLMETKGTA